MQSAIIMGGASTDHARHADDFYETPPAVTTALVQSPVWALFRGKVIWEPACGAGAICRALHAAGVRASGTDLVDRGYGLTGFDFLRTHRPIGDAIITNPPFNLAAEFIEHARTFNMPFAMLLKSQYWHAASRQALFNAHRPCAVLPLLWRPNMVPSRGKSPTMEFAWTVWGARSARHCRYIPLPRPDA